MLIVLDRHNGVPLYRQVIDQVRFHVASGVLAPGAELPSTRSLSSDLGINPMTVSKAYSLLEREGVVERRPGLSLVVTAMNQDHSTSKRRDELRKSLTRPAEIARQLGIGIDDALATFRDLLSAESSAQRRRP